MCGGCVGEVQVRSSGELPRRKTTSTVAVNGGSGEVKANWGVDGVDGIRSYPQLSAFLGLFSSPPSRSPALGPLLPLLPHDAALRSLCLFTLPRHPSPRPTATSLGPPGVRLTPPHSTLFLLLILILSLDFLSLPSSPALPLKTTIVRQDVLHLNQVLQSVLVYPPTGL